MGVSTCYFAAAGQEVGASNVTAVDILPSQDLSPNLEELSSLLGLSEIIEIKREVSSYTWQLKKIIECQTVDNVCHPLFDLIFIDGPKDWTNDGCAFFLCDKLLNPGGIILFDDYNWSYRNDERLRGKTHTEGYIFRSMSEEEYELPQIKLVFELLVMQHPSYSKFEVVNDSMALARKTLECSDNKTLEFTNRYSFNYKLWNLIKRRRR